MAYTSEEIVEWLREMQDEYEGSGTVIDYTGRYKAAADRIQQLEAALRECIDMAMYEKHVVVTATRALNYGPQLAQAID